MQNIYIYVIGLPGALNIKLTDIYCVTTLGNNFVDIRSIWFVNMRNDYVNMKSELIKSTCAFLMSSCELIVLIYVKLPGTLEDINCVLSTSIWKYWIFFNITRRKTFWFINIYLSSVCRLLMFWAIYLQGILFVLYT